MNKIIIVTFILVSINCLIEQIACGFNAPNRVLTPQLLNSRPLSHQRNGKERITRLNLKVPAQNDMDYYYDQSNTNEKIVPPPSPQKNTRLMQKLRNSNDNSDRHTQNAPLPKRLNKDYSKLPAKQAARVQMLKHTQPIEQDRPSTDLIKAIKESQAADENSDEDHESSANLRYNLYDPLSPSSMRQLWGHQNTQRGAFSENGQHQNPYPFTGQHNNKAGSTKKKSNGIYDSLIVIANNNNNNNLNDPEQFTPDQFAKFLEHHGHHRADELANSTRIAEFLRKDQESINKYLKGDEVIKNLKFTPMIEVVDKRKDTKSTHKLTVNGKSFKKNPNSGYSYIPYGNGGMIVVTNSNNNNNLNNEEDNVNFNNNNAGIELPLSQREIDKLLQDAIIINNDNNNNNAN